MLSAGCCGGGVSERGALGFSNEKSLMYCVNTLSCGSFSGFGPPFVVVMRSPDGRGAPRNGRWLTQAVRGCQGSGIRDQASGAPPIPDHPLIPDPPDS